MTGPPAVPLIPCQVPVVPGGVQIMPRRLRFFRLYWILSSSQGAPEPMKKNTNKIRLIAGSLILIGAGFALHPLLSGRDRAAVVHLTGKARIQKPGTRGWRPLRANMIVPDQSWIQTGPRSKLTLFYRGTQVRLGAKTKVKIRSLSTPRSKTASIYVKTGFTWFKVKRPSFRVTTPTAVASVRGTKFAVVHTDHGTATCVCEGKVATGSLKAGQKKNLVTRGYSDSYNRNGKRLKKDFRKYFKGLKMDRTFRTQIKRDPRLASCKSCHRMTNIATDNSKDPEEY